jgi:hypothetical protein
VRPLLRINDPQPGSPPDTLSDWPPSNMKPSRERLEEQLTLFIAMENWLQVDECERLLFETIRDPATRVHELLKSGDRWWRRKDDLSRARWRYREATMIDPLSEQAAARLRAIGHETGRRRIQPFRPA